MAIIVSFESLFRSVFTTQYTAPFCSNAIMWSFAPLKKSLYSRPLIVRVSVGEARMGASVQLGLLDAPVLVRSGVVRDPQGLSCSLSR